MAEKTGEKVRFSYGLYSAYSGSNVNDVYFATDKPWVHAQGIWRGVKSGSVVTKSSENDTLRIVTGFTDTTELTIDVDLTKIATTETQRNHWNAAWNFVNTISGTDDDNIINRWVEIVNFLNEISESDTLVSLLSKKADKDIKVFGSKGRNNKGGIKVDIVDDSGGNPSTGQATLASNFRIGINNQMTAGTYGCVTVDDFGMVTAAKASEVTIESTEDDYLSTIKVPSGDSITNSYYEVTTYNGIDVAPHDVFIGSSTADTFQPATFRALESSDIPTLAISKISGLQDKLDNILSSDVVLGVTTPLAITDSGNLSRSPDLSLSYNSNTLGLSGNNLTVLASPKLATARSLWGNSFNGTGDISGDLKFVADNQSSVASRGMRFKSSEGFIGFSYISQTIEQGGNIKCISLGWGANPEKDATSVRINDSIFTYKSYPILHSNNFNSYAPTKTGSGASGTWGISISGNAATASKLGTSSVGSLNTPIYLNSGAATAISTIKESLLTYGADSNFNGYISPIDMAVSAIHSANRIAFGSPTGVTIEYSTNGGSSWLDYGASNTQKISLISGLGSTFYIGGSDTSTTVTTSFMLRITLNAVNLGTYTRPRKALINISTQGASNCQVKIESATLGSPTSFTTYATYPISGWSGWNSIPLGFKSTFGGGSHQTSNNAVFRFTFSIGTLNSSYSNRLSVSDIAIFGDTYWRCPSTLAITGKMYTYDASKNVTFPAKVTATTFVGALSGNATTATTASKLGASNVGSATQPIYLNGGTPTACTYTLGKSVPSNAVFTDTTYSVATASANGLMSSAMFKEYMVKSVSVRQGATTIIEGGSVEDHSVYIEQTRNNITNAYSTTMGAGDVKIPNATTTYDGSMSYIDKRKLEAIFNDTKIYNSVSEISESKMEIESGIDIGSRSEILHYWQLPISTSSQCGLMSGSDKIKLDRYSSYLPKAVLGLKFRIDSATAITVISTYGDYDITDGNTDFIYIDRINKGTYYITRISIDTSSFSSNNVLDLLKNNMVKFGYSSKDTSDYEEMKLLQLNFDDDTISLDCITKTELNGLTFDCIWEIY